MTNGCWGTVGFVFLTPNRLVKHASRWDLIGSVYTSWIFMLLYWSWMHCTMAVWNKLHAVNASWGSSTVPALPPSDECFICLWRSRTEGIIQEKIADKGYYVCCNIHFPNNNVEEGELMRAEQFYLTICSLLLLGLSPLPSGRLFYFLNLAHVLSLSLSSSAPARPAFSSC